MKYWYYQLLSQVTWHLCYEYNISKWITFSFSYNYFSEFIFFLHVFHFQGLITNFSINQITHYILCNMLNFSNTQLHQIIYKFMCAFNLDSHPNLSFCSNLDGFFFLLQIHCSEIASVSNPLAIFLIASLSLLCSF